MSRVAALLQWARRAGAAVAWASPLVGEYNVGVTCPGPILFVASGRDAGEAAGRMLDVLEIAR
jgi:hypothetical protein